MIGKSKLKISFKWIFCCTWKMYSSVCPICMICDLILVFYIEGQQNETKASHKSQDKRFFWIRGEIKFGLDIKYFTT